MPSARAGVPIASANTSAIGRGLQDLGKGIASFGHIDEHQKQVKKYEAEAAYQEWKFNEQQTLDEAIRNVEPGQANEFADEWTKGYQERAKEFFKSVPDDLKPAYDQKLYGTERSLYRHALTFEHREQKRSALSKLDELSQTHLERARSPENIDAIRGDYLSLIEVNPYLSKIEKETLARKGLSSLDEAHVRGRLERGDALESILQDLSITKAPRPPQPSGAAGAPGPGGARLPVRGEGGAPDPDEPIPVRTQTIPVSPEALERAGFGPRKTEASPAKTLSPRIANAIAAAAEKHGVDAGLLSTFARIESGGNPDARTGSYKGLFQLSEGEFSKHGGGDDIYDVTQNADAAAAKIKTEAAAFKEKYGRDPSAADLYMVHQQGEAGYAAHMANPDAPAWENMASTGEGRQKGAAWAKKAIWGNVPDDVKARFPDGVESVTSRDFVNLWQEKVSRFGGGTAAIPAEEPDDYAGPYQNLGRAKRMALMTSLQNQNRAEVKAMVGKLEAMAEKGYTLPQDDLDTLSARIQRSGDPSLAKGYQDASAIFQWQDAARQARPEELDAFVRQEAERLRAGGGTPSEIKRLDIAQKLLTNMREELKRDPLAWAERAGVTKITPIDFSSAETAQASLAERVKQAEAVSRHYQHPPRYLRPDEQQQFADAAAKGGDATLIIAGGIASAGGTHAPAIIREIFKDRPGAAATIGGLVATTGTVTPAARDAADAMVLHEQKGFKPMAPSAPQARERAVYVLGTALSNLPATETGLIETANLIYETRARRAGLDKFDQSIWEQGLKEAAGERTVQIGGEMRKFGGIVDADPSLFGSRRIVLPPNISQDNWRQAIDALTEDDLIAAGAGLPAGADSVPIPLSRAKNAILVQVGQGQYALSLGNPDVPGEERWVQRHDKPGTRFRLDFNQLRPILQKRHPELYDRETTDQ